MVGATPGLDVEALEAQPPVVAMLVPQHQPLGQIVSIRGVYPAPQKQGHAGHKSADGGVIPRFGMCGVCFGSRSA